ncbi:SpaH/EbpB family LPXTG-anchored major pilin [Microbacterium sp. 2216-1]|uniref:SpaH/EbpB family LPXTG-anchored major pilin n=1 Tax=Microbacterium sp. 2216-1 TaxID=3390053 RepID=UPI0015CB03DD
MLTTHRRGRLSRLTAALGASALALLGAVSIASSASAAEPFDMPTDDGSLTIHKFEQPSPVGSANNDGGTIDTTGLTALGNVEFTVYPITDVDLTTEAGWDLARDYAADTSLATTLGTPIVLTTGVDGSTSTQTLPVGAYLVVETDSSGATLPNGDPANVVLEAAPFVVTVPIPLGEGTWNSDVHVYPKNSLTQATKSVQNPDEYGLGSIVTWSVDVKVPSLPEGETFTEFHITDTLDPRLAYVASSAQVSLDGTPIGFTESFTGADADGRGGTLAVSLDAAALTSLAAAPGGIVTLEFDTTVHGLGDIPNTATVFINEPTTGSGTETNEVNTYWGDVAILKHATGDVNATLAGASFSVYATEADALAGTNPIVANGATEFTTGADGTVSIPGLWAGETATSSQTYWLVETVAPAGYILDSTPIEVVVNAGSLTQPVSVSVPNAQESQLTLPLTGAEGTTSLMIGGGALLLIATGLAMYSMSRRRQAAVETN